MNAMQLFNQSHNRVDTKAALAASRIPDYMQSVVLEWIHDGRPVGNFLGAVIDNDLKEACKRADLQNRYLIFDYVEFFYNRAPMMCWGSPENRAAWAEMGREERQARENAPKEPPPLLEGA